MNTRKISFRSGLFVFGAVFMAAMMMFLVFRFIDQVKRNETTQMNENLVGIADSNAASVWQTVDELIGSLKMAAAFVEKYDDFKSPEVISTLKKIAEEGGFERLAINYLDGMSYTSDGHTIDASGLGRTDPIKRGEIFIDDVANALADGTPIINIHVPLRDKSGNPAAALRLAMKTEKLNKIFNLTFWNDEGYFHLIDGNGRYVATSAQEPNLTRDGNFYRMFEKVVFSSPTGREKMKLDLDKGNSGFVEYSFEGVRRHAYYAPVGINKWTMIVVIPDAVLETRTDANVRGAIVTMMHLMLILLIIFTAIYFDLANSRKKSILNEKCFRVLADQSGKIIFEWDFVKRELVSHGNFEEVFGRSFTSGANPEDTIGRENLYEDDKETLRHIYEVMGSGESIDRAKLRIKDGDGNFRWCSLSGVVIKDDRGRPYRAIITIEDIDKEEREKELLRLRAVTDPLTGLSNKSAVGQLISNAIEQSSEGDIHALICFDIDNFKNINDRFGHLFGDDVLKDVTSKIKLIFRSSDIIGRFGGDEFVMLVRNLPNMIFAAEKAEEIREAIRGTYQIGDAQYSISGSVGVAVFPNHGVTYDELYQKADEASYKAKHEGKDRVIFCS